MRTLVDVWRELGFEHPSVPIVRRPAGACTRRSARWSYPEAVTTRSTLLAGALLASVAVACASASPSPTPDPSDSAGASPTVAPLATMRLLASFPPEAGWRPILELVSGAGGLDHGTFDPSGTYRIEFDCVGAGSLKVRVESAVVASRDCTLDQIDDPTIIHGASGKLRAAVTVDVAATAGATSGGATATATDANVDWIVRFEVPVPTE